MFALIALLSACSSPPPEPATPEEDSSDTAASSDGSMYQDSDDGAVGLYHGQLVPLRDLFAQSDLEVHCIETPDGWDCEEDAPLPPPGAPTCTIYGDSGYTGSSFMFTSGRPYNCFKEIGMNDNVSSVYCTGGGTIDLFKDVNWSGVSTGYISSDSYLRSPRGFNDIASSALLSW